MTPSKATIVLISLFSLESTSAEVFEFHTKKHVYLLNALNESISVTRNGVEILHKSTIPDTSQAIFISDFNFDKYPDFAVLREFGIERRFDVYIFNKNLEEYKVNEEISALACPRVDVKRRLILSTCNHANACEVWQEAYRYKDGKLQIMERTGTTCDPTTGNGYMYRDTFKGGKISAHKTKLIKQTGINYTK